jgi:ankyrin repeat protein
LLDSLQAAEHTDTVNDLLLAQDGDRQTAGHLAAFGGNIEVLEKLLGCAYEKLIKEEIDNNFLLLKDNRKRTVCHYASVQGKQDLLQKICVWAKKEIKKCC